LLAGWRDKLANTYNLRLFIFDSSFWHAVLTNFDTRQTLQIKGFAQKPAKDYLALGRETALLPQNLQDYCTFTLPARLFDPALSKKRKKPHIPAGFCPLLTGA
jgi:hypothetical protein